jgi:hypothetical protein
MERIGELHYQLHSILGDEAIVLVAAQLERVTQENKGGITDRKQQEA